MGNVEKLLHKLEGAVGKHKQKNKVDYKELAEQKKKAIYKFKDGKNNLAFLTPKGAEDPFSFWAYHNGLQEVAWYSTPCNAYNNGEECLICNAVDELKKENYEGNRHLWFPIKQKIETWAPAICMDSEASIAEGLKWVRIPSSAVSQMTEWIRNLEKDEEPFFSDDQTQKIIVSYNKSAQPIEQYKLDRKNMKPFSAQQLEDWKSELPDLRSFFYSKSEAAVKELLDSYFERISAEIQPSTDAVDVEPEPEVEAKLNHLKKDKK